MIISRDIIISTIQQTLAPHSNILALWMEGADATGNVDQFSDIDLACSVTENALDDAISLAQSALESLGRLDLTRKATKGSNFQSATFHLEGTSPYLLVDFDAFYNRGSTFTEGDPIEKPLILFDRAGVIRFVPPDQSTLAAGLAERLAELEGTVGQSSRIEKYIIRGDFLEAFGYYHKYLLESLIEVLRMRYTPLHPDYYIVHISRHLPADVLRQVENFFQIGSLSDLETKSREALALFAETAAFLRSSG